MLTGRMLVNLEDRLAQLIEMVALGHPSGALRPVEGCGAEASCLVTRLKNGETVRIHGAQSEDGETPISDEILLALFGLGPEYRQIVELNNPYVVFQDHWCNV